MATASTAVDREVVEKEKAVASAPMRGYSLTGPLVTTPAATVMQAMRALAMLAVVQVMASTVVMLAVAAANLVAPT